MSVSESSTQALLDEVVHRLRVSFNPNCIYLFGSYADGAPREDSDLDLMVVVEHSDLNWYRRGAQAYRALRGIGVPVDVMVYTREEFEFRASSSNSFERSVRDRGRLLYAA